MSQASIVLSLRLGGAVLASVAFGLIAVATLAERSLPTAIFLGFLFGTAFIGGTGYRIVLAAVFGRHQQAPASWSGATAGAALFALALWVGVVLVGYDGRPVLMGFGVGINIAYLFAKAACLNVGCCHAASESPLRADLRVLELTGSALVLLVAGVLGSYELELATSVAIGGHLAVRLMSRSLRQRWSWGWPPLTQPGAEIAPLVAMLIATLLPF